METTQLKTFAQWARQELTRAVTARLDHLLTYDSIIIRENRKAVEQLKQQIEKTSREEVIERAAYTWFNRFCALRFMDINRYTHTGIVSPATGYTMPEILQDARQGYISNDLSPYLDRRRALDILAGRVSSPEPLQEAYSMLLMAVCNYYNTVMPFLFQPIRDYTQLLLPADLLSPGSFPHRLREALAPEMCRDVEVIGWLYQFYNAGEKERLDREIKQKNKKVSPRDLPTSTQFFTPHWIVRYLLENTLGRLWMLNRPESSLREKMDYYIEPQPAPASAFEPEQFLRVSSPLELKICDPSCGSGHLLVYAFELLYHIYREEGFDERDIPRFILENNLYGIDVNERAGELAAFALAMKARGKDPYFFRNQPKLNVCALENITINPAALAEALPQDPSGKAAPASLEELRYWEQAKNFGSLIQPRLDHVAAAGALLQSTGENPNLFQREALQAAKKFLDQAQYLCPKYHVVVTNPPYLGQRKMNQSLKQFGSQHYPTGKMDLFSMFIQRCLTLSLPQGMIGLMSPFSWMYLPCYEKLRRQLLDSQTVHSLVQFNRDGFEAAEVAICIFTLENTLSPGSSGSYISLSRFPGAALQGPKTLEAIEEPGCEWQYKVSTSQFNDIPGSPLAFWISQKVRNTFMHHGPLELYAKACKGMATGDNSTFLRQWYEVESGKTGFGHSEPDLTQTGHSRHKWFPYNKGGCYRKWYGNNEYVLNWANNGKELKAHAVKKNHGKHWSRLLVNLPYMLREGITWSGINKSYFGARYTEQGHFFDSGGPSLFPNDKAQRLYFIAFLNTKLSHYLINILNPTVGFPPGIIKKLPIAFNSEKEARINSIAQKAIDISKEDWNTYETSWDFTSNPLLNDQFHHDSFEETYHQYRQYWENQTTQLKALEEENNAIFLNTYGLQDELSPEVPLREITLTSNPHYRCGKNTSPNRLPSLHLADTVKEFISYAAGCMFGRYSLDKPGLILAGSGQDLDHYLQKIPNPTFTPDDDNVIPIVAGDWFNDHIVQRFQQFLKTTFGHPHYEINLRFIEKALGKPIHRYFLKDFYTHHVRFYKKRPIYWLFSSPRGSFNALIYIHRYRPDTVSVILNDYLRQYQSKLSSRLHHLENIQSASASATENIRHLKEIETLRKIIKELTDWEQDTLYPLATQNTPLDPDDGVKANYLKLGPALKSIPGLQKH